MGKHTSMASRKPLKELNRTPHAVWRGIGCLMILIIPILSIALAYETISYGLDNNWPIPYQLLGYPQMPKLIIEIPALNLLTSPIHQTNNFYAYLVISVAFMIVIGGFISVMYALVYRIVGPSRYGPFDAPPPKIKTKRYTR
jgi:hypothetical protein